PEVVCELFGTGGTTPLPLRRRAERRPMPASGIPALAFSLVRSRRLELPRVAPQRPQRCASTNSATTASQGGARSSKGRQACEAELRGGPRGASPLGRVEEKWEAVFRP